MNRECRRLRNDLTHGGRDALSTPRERHLAECRACADYADKLCRARAALERHLTDLPPDASFASRVQARLPRDPAEALGGAALKLLPATLLLALLLVWLTVQTPRAQPLIDSENDSQALLSWVLTDENEQNR